ncbi:hypothetical protein G7Y79_00016g040290 [Physcia stellaris]|nr:hypothetical protein G7Y79_00016g040290 [Physcia stellaris]
MMNETETKEFLNNLRGTLTALSNLRIPTITAIASIALGGGLELALATTLRVFSSVAEVGLPETRLGIIPGAGGTYRLRKLIGESHAQQMILTGRAVQGRNAFRLGLCNYVMDCEKGAKPKIRNSSVATTTGLKHEETATAAKEENTEGVNRGANGKVEGSKKSKVDFEDGVDRKALVLNQAIRIANEICQGGPVAVSAAFGAVKFESYNNEARGYDFCLDQGDEDRREALAAFKEKRRPRFSGRRTHSYKLKGSRDLKMEMDGAEGVLKPEEGDNISNRLAAFREPRPRFSRRQSDFKLKPFEDLETKKDGAEGLDKSERGKSLKDILDEVNRPGRYPPPDIPARLSSYLSMFNLQNPRDEIARHALGLLEFQVDNLQAKEERLMGQFHAIRQMKETP